MSQAQKCRAVKTKVSGHKKIGLPEDVHEYDSKLEARCAEILLKHGIKFTPHVTFQCFDKNTEGPKPFKYTVDFLFDQPQQLNGISPAVDAIEVKGFLSGDDILRRDSLKYFHRKRAWITTRDMVEMWSREGIRDEKTSKAKQNRKSKS
jgi:hypothetical protein